MSTVIDALLGDCQRILQGDRALIAELCERGFACRARHWEFQLPALHAWLCERAAVDAGDYRGFVRQLYASDLNRRLAVLDAEVVVAANHGKVSRSLYRLQHRS